MEYKSIRGVYSLSRAITWADDVRDSFPGSRDGGPHDFKGGENQECGRSSLKEAISDECSKGEGTVI